MSEPIKLVERSGKAPHWGVTDALAELSGWADEHGAIRGAGFVSKSDGTYTWRVAGMRPVEAVGYLTMLINDIMRASEDDE